MSAQYLKIIFTREEANSSQAKRLRHRCCSASEKDSTFP